VKNLISRNTSSQDDEKISSSSSYASYLYAFLISVSPIYPYKIALQHKVNKKYFVFQSIWIKKFMQDLMMIVLALNLSLYDFVRGYFGDLFANAKLTKNILQ